MCPRCVGKIPRTLLMVPTWSYTKGPNDLHVNFFIGSRVNAGKVAGRNVQVVQKTNYLWSGAVDITINPEEPKSFSVDVRVPNRSTIKP